MKSKIGLKKRLGVLLTIVSLASFGANAKKKREGVDPETNVASAVQMFVCDVTGLLCPET
jgi:hypothetical protein